MVTPEPITVGTTPLSFTEFSTVIDVQAGNGISVVQTGGVHNVSVQLATNCGLTFCGTGLAVNPNIAGSCLTYTSGVLAVCSGCFLGVSACANDSAKLNNQSASYYAPIDSPNFTTCIKTSIACISSCVRSPLISGNTVCATTCFMGSGAGLTGIATSLKANDSSCLNGILPAGYLLSGGTAVCATCSVSSKALCGCIPSCFLGATATAVCATCAISAKALCGCVPASFLLSGGTAICATTAGNALCLGGNLANTYAPLASPNFTTCTCAPIVCATTCFKGSGAGLTGTAASLKSNDSSCLNGILPAGYLLSGGTAVCAISATTAGNALCLGGNLANTFAPILSPNFCCTVNIKNVGYNTIPDLCVGCVCGELWGGNTTSDRGFLRLSAGGGSSLSAKVAIDLQGYSSSGCCYSELIRFLTAGNNTRMTITCGGNIAIGTCPNPTANLDVCGTFKASTCVCGAIVCSNTCMLAGTCVTGTIACFSTSVISPIISGNTCATATLVCGACGKFTTCACSPVVIGSTCVCGAVVCATTVATAACTIGTTCVCGTVFLASTSSCSPIHCGACGYFATIVCSPIITGSTKVCSPIVIGTSCVCSPTVLGSTCVCSPITCGSTCVASAVIYGSTCSNSPLHCGACTLATTCVCSPVIIGSTCVNTPIVVTTAGLQLCGGASSNICLITNSAYVLVGTASSCTSLYYSGSEKLKTLTDGACICGNACATCFVGILCGTACCAVCAGNATTVAGCTPSCFLGAGATACNALCANGQCFTWTNSDDNPTYLWGADTCGTAILASRANMTVNCASYASNACNANCLCGTVGTSYALKASPTFTCLITMNAGALLSSPTLGSACGTVIIGSQNCLYGLAIGIGGGGDTWIQSQRFDASTAVYNIVFQPSGGFVCVAGILCAGTCGTGPDWVATSDCRLKTCIQPIKDGLSTVLHLQGVSYQLCCDEKHECHLGLIAQDVQKVLPEVVSHTKPNESDVKYGITDDMLGLKYGKLSAVLIEAIKELDKKVHCLCNELNYWRNTNYRS